MQPYLLTLSTQLLIQKPIAVGWVLKGYLFDLFTQGVTLLCTFVACRGTFLIVTQLPVRNPGVAGKTTQAQFAPALTQLVEFSHAQSRRTFREMSSSSSFSATIRFKRSFSRSSAA